MLARFSSHNIPKPVQAAVASTFKLNVWDSEGGCGRANGVKVSPTQIITTQHNGPNNTQTGIEGYVTAGQDQRKIWEVDRYEITKKDPVNDLALLTCSSPDPIYASSPTIQKAVKLPHKGDDVYLVGDKESLGGLKIYQGEYAGVATDSFTKAKLPICKFSDFKDKAHEELQGLSGSALLNETGELIGILRGGDDTGSPSVCNGTVYFAPIEAIRDFLKSVNKKAA